MSSAVASGCDTIRSLNFLGSLEYCVLGCGKGRTYDRHDDKIVIPSKGILLQFPRYEAKHYDTRSQKHEDIVEDEMEKDILFDRQVFNLHDNRSVNS